MFCSAFSSSFCLFTRTSAVTVIKAEQKKEFYFLLLSFFFSLLSSFHRKLSSFHPRACSKQGAICKTRHKTDEKWWRNALTDGSSGRRCFFIGVAARELISRTFPPPFGIVPLLWIQITIEGEFITQILISGCALFSCLLIRVLLFAGIKVRSAIEWLVAAAWDSREFYDVGTRYAKNSGLGNLIAIRLLRNARKGKPWHDALTRNLLTNVAHLESPLLRKRNTQS